MLTYEKEKKKELEQERELEKKLLGIMEKHKDEPCDKIVKYRISLEDEEEVEAWRKFHGETYYLLDEAKFFYLAFGIERPVKSCSITGTPEFAKELCEFFVEQAGISKDRIGEAEEVTKEEIEKWITYRSELLVARLGWYQDEAYGCAPRLIGLNDKVPQTKVCESYDGELSFKLDTERAFVDLDHDIVMCGIKKYLNNLPDTKYTIVERTIMDKTISFTINSKHNHCIALWDIFMKGFGRHNMRNRYLIIK